MSSEQLTLRQAAVFCNRSIHTLRTWIRKGLLNAHRQGDQSNAPLMVHRDELDRVLGQMGLQTAGGKAGPMPLPPAYAPPLTTHMQDQSYLGDIIDELRADKQRLQLKVDQLEEDLRNEREFARELQRHMLGHDIRTKSLLTLSAAQNMETTEDKLPDIGLPPMESEEKAKLRSVYEKVMTDKKLSQQYHSRLTTRQKRMAGPKRDEIMFGLWQQDVFKLWKPGK